MLKKEQMAEGMFRSATQTTKTLAPPQAHVGPLKYCSNCLHWRPRPSQQQFGECSKSSMGGPSPLVTTDLQCCTLWTGRPNHP